MANDENRNGNPNVSRLGGLVGIVLAGGLLFLLLSDRTVAEERPEEEPEDQAPTFVFSSCPVVPIQIDTSIEQPIVSALQRSLNFLGFDAGTVDGLWGPNTESALMAFQRANNITDDGIAGPQTYATLNNRLQIRGGSFICPGS